MFRGRKIVAEAPARQASPQVQKLTIQAASCDVPPELVERDAEQEGPEEPSRKADAGIEPDRCPLGTAERQRRARPEVRFEKLPCTMKPAATERPSTAMWGSFAVKPNKPPAAAESTKTKVAMVRRP